MMTRLRSRLKSAADAEAEAEDDIDVDPYTDTTDDEVPDEHNQSWSSVAENLPDEVLLCIFSKLPISALIVTVRRTCWRWYHLSYDASLWETIDLSAFKCGYASRDKPEISEGVKCLLKSVLPIVSRIVFADLALEEDVFELFGTLKTRTTKVKFLNLKSLDFSYSAVSYRSLRIALTANPDIEELILSYTKIPFSQAMKEAIHLHNLKKLVFHDMRSLEWDLVLSHNHDDQVQLKTSLMRVPRHCRQLEVVELHTIWCHLDDDIIQQFIRYCPNLQRISFTWSSQITVNAFQNLNPSSHHITELVMSGRQAMGSYLDFVLPYFPSLSELTVSGYSVHIDDCRAIARCCPYLRELTFEKSSVENEGPMFHSLSSRNSLCGAELNIISEKCRHLRKLHVPSCDIDDVSVKSLSERCLYLEDIDFSQCKRLTGKSIRALSNNSLCLKKVNFLEVGIKCGELLWFFKKCSKLEEAVFDSKYIRVNSLAKTHSPPPRNLRVALNPPCKSASLEDIPFMDMMPYSEDSDFRDLLEGLKKSETLKSRESVAPFCLQSVSNHVWRVPVKVAHCHLRRLSLKDCTCSGERLQALFRECPDLTHVALDGCKGLTSQTVCTLVRHCPGLKTLSIPARCNNCPDTFYGDLALLEIAKYGTELEVVNLLYNTQITSVGLTALFLAMDTTLRSLHAISLCVGQGYQCTVQTVVAHGLKRLTEYSKESLKSAAAAKGQGSFMLLHLEYCKRK